MADILKFFFTFCQDDSILFSGSNMFLYGR
jgi:hypothetical protein